MQVADGLLVLRELAEATSNSAAANVSQLPRNIETAGEVVSGVVDLLLHSASGNASGDNPLKEVDVNEVCANSSLCACNTCIIPCIATFK